MATPTDEQQMRATLRRAERNHGTEAAAFMAVKESVGVLGLGAVIESCAAVLPKTPILGAAEAAEILGMKATNLKRLSPPLLPVATISGRIPVYTESDVMAAKARREARRQPQLEGMEA